MFVEAVRAARTCSSSCNSSCSGSYGLHVRGRHGVWTVKGKVCFVSYAIHNLLTKTRRPRPAQADRFDKQSLRRRRKGMCAQSRRARGPPGCAHIRIRANAPIPSHLTCQVCKPARTENQKATAKDQQGLSSGGCVAGGSLTGTRVPGPKGWIGGGGSAKKYE